MDRNPVVTTAAVMLVKDEADIIEPIMRWLLTQVDAIFVNDNISTDGTTEILRNLRSQDDRITVGFDEEPGYYQAQKTTALARTALDHGHTWVVPIDADEFWYSPFGRIADVLADIDKNVLFARAALLNHVTSNHDDLDDPNPLTRIGWRLLEHGKLHKIACRTNSHLTIDMGNHDAVTVGRVRSNASHTVSDQLYIHHYPWRSEEQYVRKITNGARAYAAAPGLDEAYGQHWKAFGLPDDPDFDKRAREWYWDWGYRHSPELREDEVMYDPAPLHAHETP